MKPNPLYLKKPPRFWANVKLISEQAGYSIRCKGSVKTLRTYSMDDAVKIYSDEGLDESFLTKETAFLNEVIGYLNFRTDVLTNYVQPLFMDRDEAQKEYLALRKKYSLSRAETMNKQKGDKRHPAYFAGMVSMIAEKVLGAEGFVDDARRLSLVSSNGIAEYVFSRRFDGALPSIINPLAVWEIKEYYGTTTFGSRVADGVYETLLDGFEINEAETVIGRRINHFLFIDDRFTWWDCGRSYLCRMIDMLHTGHVDEIFFGKEILSEWEKCLIALSGNRN